LGIGVPKPLIGSELDDNAEIQFGIVESVAVSDGGPVETDVTVSFIPPATVVAAGPGRPLIDLVTQVGDGGTLTVRATKHYIMPSPERTVREMKAYYRSLLRL
jgi:hypothetical protein